MKTNWLFLLLLAWLGNAVASHPNQQDIDTFISKHKLGTQDLTLVALPLEGNPHQAFSYNAHNSINPASLIKLVTTYAALELLGPEYTWHTSLYTDGEQKGNSLHGNLYFKPSGDPRFGIEQLWLLLRELKLQGIEHIKGDLVLDDSAFYFPEPLSYQGQDNDKHRPFMVEANSLLVNFNSQYFRVSAGENGASITSNPQIDGVSIINQVKVLPPATCSGKIKISYHPDYSNTKASMRIAGSMPQGCTTGRYFSLLPHDRYTAGIIRQIWQESGGSLDGQTKLGSVPDNAKILGKIPSRTVAEVIRDINKYSNNSMAKQLFLTIGSQQRNATSSLDDQQLARQAIESWWRAKGLETNQLSIDNGSGLSRNASLSAKQLADMLVQATHSQFFAEFAASLPIVAIDGTMRERLTHSKIKTHARIKTGTLRNVRAIAGYVRDKERHPWVIVAIINNSKVSLQNNVLDGLLESLYTQQPVR